MKRKKVTKYYADDNTEFDTAKLCQEYEASQKFTAWYEENDGLFARDSRVDVDDLLCFLTVNKEMILSVLK